MPEKNHISPHKKLLHPRFSSRSYPAERLVDNHDFNCVIAPLLEFVLQLDVEGHIRDVTGQA